MDGSTGRTNDHSLTEQQEEQGQGQVQEQGREKVQEQVH